MSEAPLGHLEPAPESEKEFILREFLVKYVRYLPWLIASVVICLLLAWLNLRWSKPIYKVNGKIFINKDKPKSGNNLEEIFMFGDNINLSNEVQILQSKPLVERVVKKLHLNQEYYNKGNILTSRIFGVEPFRLIPLSLKDSTSAYSIIIKANDHSFTVGEDKTEIPYGTEFLTSKGLFRLERDSAVSMSIFGTDDFIITVQSPTKVAESLIGALQVAPVNDQASILQLSLETENINLGKAFIDTLMEVYGEVNQEDKRRISTVTIQFINERLDTLKHELGKEESKLLDFKEKNEVYDLKSQSGVYFDKAAENTSDLSKRKIELSILDYLTKYLGQEKNRFEVVPSTLGIQEPTLAPLILEYNKQQLAREAIIRSTGKLNPSIATAEANLEKLRGQLIETLHNVRQAYTITIADIERQLTTAQSKISSVPAKEKQLLEIERSQKIKQDLYLYLLQKREEAAISSAATVSNSHPLEYSASSGVPVRPQPRTQYLLAFFAGIFIPAAIIMLADLMNDKITTKDEIEKFTSTPVLGEIGHIDNYKANLVVTYGSRSIIAEQFRIARTNLQYLITKERRPVIMITSSMSGEGKSFIAANFGAAISLSGTRTVILEFDIRKPRLLKNLGMRSSTGLSNYIIGKAELDEIIKPVKDYDNLFVIGCGPIPPNPAELLLEERVSILFQELKQRFDVIVVDTAPVGLVSDAQVLGRYADSTLYIVRQGYTLRKQLRLVEGYYHQKRLPHMALMVNDIKLKGRYSGYYGYGQYANYSYGKTYGYSSEYFDVKKEETSVLKAIGNFFRRKRR